MIRAHAGYAAAIRRQKHRGFVAAVAQGRIAARKHSIQYPWGAGGRNRRQTAELRHGRLQRRLQSVCGARRRAGGQYISIQ